MAEMYDGSDVAALATTDHVDMTFSHLFPSAESALAVDFHSIYNSTCSPNRTATADEIALADDDDDVRSQQRLLHIAYFGPVRVVQPTLYVLHHENKAT